MTDTVAAAPLVARQLLCPFDLTVDVVDRMLNFEIADDPYYTGLEVQVFDDETHGRGMAVLVTRRKDDRVDCYRQSGLDLDPNDYEIGGGVGEWVETTISPARFEITPRGVDLHVAFCDRSGRLIELSIDDRSGRRRAPATMLAPLGAGIQRPTSLMLVWMRAFDLLRVSGREPEIHIDRNRVTTGKLPGEWLHRRRLIKYASDLGVVRLNAVSNASPTKVDTNAPGPVELDATGTRIVALTARGGGHTARFDLAPAVADLGGLRPGSAIEGTWRLAIDDTSHIIGGSWSAVRNADAVDLSLEVKQGWHPLRLPPLMRLVTTVARVFRDWPTTYRWHATIELGTEPTINARWERTTGERGQSYRRLSGTQ
jgi:hypothetical protein